MSFDNCQPEVASDAISGTAAQYVGKDVSVFKFYGQSLILAFCPKTEKLTQNLNLTAGTCKQQEVVLMVPFFVRYAWCYVPAFGIPAAIVLYVLVRSVWNRHLSQAD